MKRVLAIALLAVTTLVPIAMDLEAGRVVRTTRTRHGRVTRVRVTVRPGFPIRRTLPNVVVRPYAVRVAPRVYLGAVAFTAVAIATIPHGAYAGSEELDQEDGWTDFAIDLDRRGSGLLLEVEKGPAQISFAEVVFENGEAQIVDFDDHIHTRGVYTLLNFKDGRKVDHVRVIAKAEGDESRIRVHLLV